MKYIMTIIWSLLIGSAVSYVLSSMAQDPFNLPQTFILASVFAIVIILLGEFIITEEKNE